MLVFEPDFDGIYWYVVRSGALVETGWLDKKAGITDHPVIARLFSEADHASYVLLHGGQAGFDFATPVDSASLQKLEENLRFLPEQNHWTLELIQMGLQAAPVAHHTILCETSFFDTLPDCAATYALPVKFRNNGLRRYGGSGLFHRWAWEQTANLNPSVKKLVSVYLGDHPNVAAICNGQPMETSVGFSCVDGIPSRTCCGALDPVVPLQISAGGVGTDELYRILTQESGWKVFSQDAQARQKLAALSGEARTAIQLGLIKMIGACFAALGGADVLLFSGIGMQQNLSFVRELCRRLHFLGISDDLRSEGQNLWRLAGSEPGLDVVAMNYERALHLALLAGAS